MATLFQFNPFHIRGETYMAKIHWALACLLLFVTAAAAQEHYTEGPVWRVTLVRVKPAQMDAYLPACVRPPSHYSRRKNVRGRSSITRSSSRKQTVVRRIGTLLLRSNTRITLPWTA